MPSLSMVIGGAPKCGTSSLFRWLNAHPEVCGSSVKETNFLLDRGHPLFNHGCNVHSHGVEAYGAWFPPTPAGARILMEGTTHYLYQSTAPEVLASLDPVPYVVFLLRKPSERVYSSYRYTQNNLGVLGAEVTFRQFLMLANGADPALISRPGWGGNPEIWRNDVGYSRYAEHLARWAERFPRERTHVFLAESMWKDTPGFVRHIAGIIGIDPAFYESYTFPRYNESYTVRNQRLQRLARRLGAAVPRGTIRDLLRSGYMRTATEVRSERTADDADALCALEATYAADKERLVREWGVDISLWDESHAACVDNPATSSEVA
jgi:hypothetical protein